MDIAGVVFFTVIQELKCSKTLVHSGVLFGITKHFQPKFLNGKN